MDFNEQRQLAKLGAMEAEKLRSASGIPTVFPVDPVDIATRIGCDVRYLYLPSLEGVYSPTPQPAIVIGSDRPAGRRRYTCAHELGHHIFHHGARIEDLNSEKQRCKKSPEEFIADTFAGFLLMPQLAVYRALKDRGWVHSSLVPEQVWQLATYFGVGYSSIINHLAYSLRLLSPDKAAELVKFKTRKYKDFFGTEPRSELLILDSTWSYHAIDMEAGDTLVVPRTCTIIDKKVIRIVEERDDVTVCKAHSPGLGRIGSDESDWAINVRVSKKNYEGLAQFRFLEDEED